MEEIALRHPDCRCELILLRDAGYQLSFDQCSQELTLLGAEVARKVRHLSKDPLHEVYPHIYCSQSERGADDGSGFSNTGSSCRSGGAVNVRRVAALLRELAEALEQEQPTKPRRRQPVEPTNAPKPDAVAKVRRALRRQGVAA